MAIDREMAKLSLEGFKLGPKEIGSARRLIGSATRRPLQFAGWGGKKAAGLATWAGRTASRHPGMIIGGAAALGAAHTLRRTLPPIAHKAFGTMSGDPYFMSDVLGDEIKARLLYHYDQDRPGQELSYQYGYPTVRGSQNRSIGAAYTTNPWVGLNATNLPPMRVSGNMVFGMHNLRSG